MRAGSPAAEQLATSLEAKEARAQEACAGLGFKPALARSAEEVRELESYKRANDETRQKMERAKGWHDGGTGEVVINLYNNRDVEDVVATVLHEGAAHKGLDELLGGPKAARCNFAKIAAQFC